MIATIPKPQRRAKQPRQPIRSRGKAGSRTSRRRKLRTAKLHDADRLFSLFIRTRDDWQCKACGRGQAQAVMQCAHIVSRRYRAVRWFPLNAVCLCAACHVSYTYDPIAWEDWVDDHYPGRLSMLKQVARASAGAVDYDEVCCSLKSEMEVLRVRWTA